MKRFVSCLIVAALLLASLLAMIPASAAAPTEFNVMGGSNATTQFAGEGNVFYFDYHKFVALGNTFPMADSKKGDADLMLRIGNNDGSGTAGVCDGVKNDGTFYHSISSEAVNINGNEYNHVFGYSFKESVIIEDVKIYLTATTPITDIDVYGATYSNGVYGKESAKTLLASISVDKSATTNIDGVDVVIVESVLDEAYEVDYVFFALYATDGYRVYEIEINGIYAKDSIENFNDNALKAQIARAKDLNENDWTAETWSAFLSAANAADAVNKNASATSTEITTAANNLKNAIDALEKKPINRNELQAAITEANNLVESSYTPDSWAPLATALANAKTVNNNANATQDEADNAAMMLRDAIDNLSERADKTAFNTQIARYNALKEEDYTPNSWENLKDVIGRVSTIKDNLNISQSDVDDATAMLESAINGLLKRASKDDIDAKIEEANALNSSDYTAGSWSNLQFAIEKANQVKANLNATNEEVAKAVADIQAAINSLKAPGDKNALQAEIEKCQNLIKDDYTLESWEAFELEMSLAIGTLGDENATDEDITNAIEHLQSAISNLKSPANKIALTLAISAAKNLEKKNYDVTTLIWNEFQWAIDDAETVVNDINATQKEVDAVLAALEAKVEALTPKKNNNKQENNTPTEETDVEETNAPETDAPKKSKKGCKSTVAISALAIVATIGTALVIKKKD